MKTIIAGGRTVTDYNLLLDAIEASDFEITTVISGAANGADRLGERFAKERDLPLMLFPADWATHGKAAGPLRNAEMASVGEALIALWDGKSKGTRSMISEAKKAGLRVYTHRV